MVSKIEFDVGGDMVKFKYYVHTVYDAIHVDWEIKKVNGHKPCDRVKKFIKDNYNKGISDRICAEMLRRNGFVA